MRNNSIEELNARMGNNSLDILNQFFGSEVSYFYNHYAKLDPNRKIEITLADSIYETVMQLNMSKSQKDIIIMQGKYRTDSLNGTVILCNDIKQDGVQVVFSLKALAQYMSNNDVLTPIGTINHEFTHANDFVDFAEYLGVTDSEAIIRSENWFTVQMWSEFHARRNGFLRVLKAATNETLSFPEGYAEHELELIRTMWREKLEENELYELMQLCGRYSVIEEVFPEEVTSFNEDMLNGVYSGIKLCVCNQIYSFCEKHKSFDEFINDIDILKSLIT